MATSSRVQTLRSSVADQRPADNSRLTGEIYVNFADLALGVINPARIAQDLTAIRIFSTLANYLVGHYVIYAGQLYRAKAVVSAGPFVPGQWDAILPLAGLLDVDGSGSGLDADLLDGQHGAYYRDLANATGSLPGANFSDASHGNRAGGTLHAAVTTTVNGFMSAVDKVKLNAVEAGATGDMTPAEILGAVITVDGASSGLDADLLDGAHGAFYLDASNLNAGFLPGARFNDASHGVRGGGNLHAIATASVAGFLVDSPSDGKTYGRKDGNWATMVGGAVVGDNAPAGVLLPGQLWWESDTGSLYLYYDDGNSQQWVQVNGQVAGAGTPERIAHANINMSWQFRPTGYYWAGTTPVIALNDNALGTGTDVLRITSGGRIYWADTTGLISGFVDTVKRTELAFVPGSGALDANIYATIQSDAAALLGSLSFIHGTALAGLGNTATLNISAGNGTNANRAGISLNKWGSGGTCAIWGRSGSVNRWVLELGDGSAEGGTNSGSSFGVSRYSDAGSSIDTPFSLSRQTGNALLGNALRIADAATITWHAKACAQVIDYGGPTSDYGLQLCNRLVSGASSAVIFGWSSSVAGSIVVNNSASTSYNTTSDIRLKEGVKEVTDARTLVDALEVVEYAPPPETRIAKNVEGTEAGPIIYMGIPAQQAFTVFPAAVTPPDIQMSSYREEAVPGEDDFMPWMIDYSKFVPMILANTQENNARLDELEARLQALEAA